MATKRPKRREVVDQINDCFLRIQSDLKSIGKEIELLSPEMRKQVRYEMRAVLKKLLAEVFGEGG